MGTFKGENFCTLEENKILVEKTFGNSYKATKFYPSKVSGYTVVSYHYMQP